MGPVKQNCKLKQRVESEIEELNKSRIARDFYRKVFNDNLINLQDADARKEIVDKVIKPVVMDQGPEGCLSLAMAACDVPDDGPLFVEGSMV